MGETYYDVLGVSADASVDEIREAYRERVLETHPDRNDDLDAAEQFKRVTAAESVLTDETERARYDRLGHDAYVRWGNHFPENEGADEPGGGTKADRDGSRDGPADTSSSGASAGTSTSGASAGRASTEGTAGRTSSGGSAAGSAEEPSTGATGDDGSSPEATGDDGPSHHARQRYRRERRTAAADGWWFGDETDRRGTDRTHGSGSTTASEVGGTDWTVGSSRSRGRSSTASFVGCTGSSTGSSRGRGRSTTARSGGFAVHGWDDEIQLASPYESIDRSTAIVLACLSIVYPLLVYASLSPQLHRAVNGIVACCTLVIVGYILTKPRVALAAFGTWGLLIPPAMAQFGPVHPFSFVGLLVVAAFWVPFGYAAAVWWALRP